MYYTPKEVASLFNLSVMTVHRMIARGKINAIRIGDSWRVPEKEVERIKREGVK